MEPFGAVCVGYVKKNSPNHRMLKQLAAVTKEEDEAFFDLQLPMAGAIDWNETESLHIVKRVWAQRLWEMSDMTGLDLDPVIFPSKPGKAWKRKDVRQWLLRNSYPTMNYRLTNERLKMHPFPWDKYFGKANAGGVGLVFLSDIDIGVQFRATRDLRPHLDLLTKEGIHFTILEKSEKTLEMRQAMKLGLDESIDHELILISQDAGRGTEDKLPNFWHGNPKKYRLTNFSKTSIESFFAAYNENRLPTYWASSEEGRRNKKRKAGNLAAWNFDESVYEANKHLSIFVAFFNDDPKHGCQECKHGREVWEQVTKEVQATKVLRSAVWVASLDQSAHEHGEDLVAGKLAQPVIVFYPPGNAEKRKKRRRVLHQVSESFTKDSILKGIRDLVEVEDEEEEEL
eukprot:TRINITY_DN73862_c0_g1_i1.p1 TRINITY_DN73862_c0_g1~~TRINITY_DN73862_c0_g1_i1.p1  ORF type:complete len:440 (-),score=70.84 TRINITY_DN73862_c0_g1_i1:306-1502(-)